MRDDFDAELYLRLAGERMLLEESPQKGAPWQPVVEVAAALVAVGALDDALAQAVVEDYQSALALRGRGVPHRPYAPTGAPARLRPARVAGCAVSDVTLSWGTLSLQYVVLSDRATTVVAMFTPPTVGARVVHPGAPPTPRMADDKGRVEFAHFDVGGRMQPGPSRLVTAAPLSAQTEWIEIDGTRVDLIEESLRPAVAVEPLPDSDPAERYLRSRLTAGRHGPHAGPRPPLLDVAIETLVAAGSIDAGSPVLGEVQAVLDAFSGRPPASVLPDPWASLLRGPTPNTRSGRVLLGAVTPSFDDVTVGLEALSVLDGVAELRVEVTPVAALGGPVFPTSIHDAALGWWGQDDLGHWLLGSPTRWSADNDVAVGTIQLWPDLDPRARLLRLELTARRHRAIVHVPLPATEERR